MSAVQGHASSPTVNSTLLDPQLNSYLLIRIAVGKVVELSTCLAYSALSHKCFPQRPYSTACRLLPLRSIRTQALVFFSPMLLESFFCTRWALVVWPLLFHASAPTPHTASCTALTPCPWRWFMHVHVELLLPGDQGHLHRGHVLARGNTPASSFPQGLPSSLHGALFQLHAPPSCSHRACLLYGRRFSCIIASRDLQPSFYPPQAPPPVPPTHKHEDVLHMTIHLLANQQALGTLQFSSRIKCRGLRWHTHWTLCGMCVRSPLSLPITYDLPVPCADFFSCLIFPLSHCHVGWWLRVTPLPERQ